MDYNIGDIIEYTAFGGERRRVVVTAKLDDVKNDRPGFDGTQIPLNCSSPWDLAQEVWADCPGVWGYDDQITRVVTRG